MNANPNKITAIVVTYNGVPWLARCFGSLIADGIHVIAVDNGSSDGTVDRLLSEYSSVDIIATGQNLGFGKANNLAIRKAYDYESDYVFLLNQDAWIKKGAIDELINAHIAQPEYGIISPLQLNGNGSDLDFNFAMCLTADRCPSFVSDAIVTKLQKRVYSVEKVPAAAWLISRACIETVGGFSPAFSHYGEDNNYIHRALYHGYKTGVFPYAYAFHDRECRPKSRYFDDEEIEERDICVKLSDPNNCFSAKPYMQKYKLAAALCLLKGNINDAKKYYKRTFAIRKRENQLLQLRQSTKSVGMHFI